MFLSKYVYILPCLLEIKTIFKQYKNFPFFRCFLNVNHIEKASEKIEIICIFQKCVFISNINS